MAEGGQNVSSFPLPPMQYIERYTDENIKRGRAPKPPPPIQDQYVMFGQNFSNDDTIIQPLESMRYKRLYPNNYDHKRELKKMNHSILMNFLDMIDILIKVPDSSKRTEKLQDINLLIINMHHLINEFRPHQARETLRVMMEFQKKQRLETVERFQKHLDKVVEILQNCATSLPEMDKDNKLLINTELMDTDDDKSKVNGDDPTVDDTDDMMCNIIDDMSL